MIKKVLLILLAVLVCVLAFYWLVVKDYNPTQPRWQTDFITQMVKISDIIFIPQTLKPHNLPIYELTIAPKDLIFLQTNLPDFNKGEVLSAQYKKFVPAKFTANGQEYMVEVRFRGYDFDHWARPKKSWRIKFADNVLFANHSDINLIIPEDRGMYLEQLSQHRAKKMGLIVPDSQFVFLTVNGQSQGVYWETEQWGEQFLLNQGLLLSDLYGEDDEKLIETEDFPLYQSTQFWRKYAVNPDSDSFPRLETMLRLLNQSSDKEFFQQLPQLLDMNNFLTWQAHSVLMGSVHQDGTHNIRLYFNPKIQKFQVMPWDVLGENVWPENYNPLVDRVLTNSSWVEQRNLILAQYVTNADNLTNDLAYYDQLVDKVQPAVFKDDLKYFSNLGYLRQVQKTRQMIISQFKLIQTRLNQLMLE